MYYVIVDSEGSSLASFDDLFEAEDSLMALSAQGPDDDLLLLTYAEDGSVVRSARLPEDVAPEVAKRTSTVRPGFISFEVKSEQGGLAVAPPELAEA